MHKTAITFALRYNFRLGRDGFGTYYLHGAGGEFVDCSNRPTAQSAIRMMRHHVRRGRMEVRAA